MRFFALGPYLDRNQGSLPCIDHSGASLTFKVIHLARQPALTPGLAKVKCEPEFVMHLFVESWHVCSHQNFENFLFEAHNPIN